MKITSPDSADSKNGIHGYFHLCCDKNNSDRKLTYLYCNRFRKKSNPWAKSQNLKQHAQIPNFVWFTWYGCCARLAPMESERQNEGTGRRQLILVSQAGIFLAVLLALQLVGLPNPVTGTLVNALLLFVLLRLGARYAMMLGILSPIGGIVSGHLPAPLYPVLPVIMTGNLLMLAGYYMVQRLPAPVRYSLPAIAKALVIWGAGSMIVNFLKLSDQVQWLFMPIATMQFFTAAIGMFVGEKFYNAVSQHDKAAAGN